MEETMKVRLTCPKPRIGMVKSILETFADSSDIAVDAGDTGASTIINRSEYDAFKGMVCSANAHIDAYSSEKGNVIGMECE